MRTVEVIAKSVLCVVAVLMMAITTSVSSLAAPPAAIDGRVVGDQSRTRFVLDLTAEIEVNAFTLASPYRVVIDLPEVDFQLPAGSGEGRGLIASWRYGGFAAGRSRIVLDATGPVKIDKAFVLSAVAGQPARLVVDLLKATDVEFAAEQQRTQLARETANGEQSGGKSDRLPSPSDNSSRSKPLVIIDPGHGGIDAGTVAADGTMEKDVVLALAKRLRDHLEATGKVAVMLTREDDTFVALDDRVKFARDHVADLFISIHADSEHVGEVRGATVYTLSDNASDREAAALASKENASDSNAGLSPTQRTDEVNDILTDLTRRETKNFSVFFANGLVGDLSSTTRMIKNPHRSAGFRVLLAYDVPSVLLEIGYLSNEQDEKLLTSDEWRSRMADAMTQAILRFLSQKSASLSPH
ncbi:N-acetylmuramoyl-L-alanine amidase [Oryzibacter oryziterrae]|uniref:N-acetylmuramoyl-L-alanine amidase n=1 Tax=Oryzibacter oryziterrae TaxID=2766474 RepID=UPI001F1593A4|nr:N-acetylmuramoyl-L-alanine amidase [Oryzibacter oryziterrae]